MKITGLEIVDLRFPTSLTGDGTDAVHKDPDYSAAYVILHTDGGLEGHGFTFTIGRGNEVCAEAIRAFAPLVVGRDVDEIFAGPAAFWRTLARRLAAALARAGEGRRSTSRWRRSSTRCGISRPSRRGKPLWKLLSDMTPRQIVDCIDFTYITDALTADEAIAILERQHATKAERERSCGATATPPTRPPPAGWATPTTRCACSAARRLPTDSRTSR